VERESAIDAEAIAELRAGIGGDEELLAELIDEFLTDSPAQLASLRAALGSGDADEARRTAHMLKGTSRTFGAETLGLLCDEVEAAARAGELDAGLARLGGLDAEWARARDALLALRAGR
jgi:HPt (histidine-containing phosphotransfer) domain-containing protein